MNEKKKRMVIHLQIDDLHYYFGSLKALTESFTKIEIGIEYGSLRNYGLSENKSFKNSKCIIRKGYLETIKGGRGQKST